MSLYEFGSFRLDIEELCLLRNGQVLPLPHKALEVLALLVRHHGHLLTKDELMRQVWPNSIVEDGNLTVSMSKIRRVLGEHERREKYIFTLPRRGYRFVADVKQISETTFSSIAVLPFKSDSEVEYLSDGLTELVIFGLSALRGIRVVPASAIFQHKGTGIDSRRIAIRFGVSALITGKVIVRGDDFIVSTELLDVQHNELIWGEYYHRKTSNLLATKHSIGLQIIESLKLRVSTTRKRKIGQHKEAHQLYLRGRYYWNKRSEDDLKKSLDYFKRAIQTDKTAAQAYAGLADSYNVLGFYTLLPPKMAFSRAKASATRALALDPCLADAHAAMGYAKLYYDWNVSGAGACFKQALELNPRSATAHQFYGNLLTVTGNFDAAIAEFHRALAIEPLSLIVNAALGCCYYFARRYDDAIKQCKSALELDRRFEPANLWLGWAYQQKGMWEEAFLVYREMSKLSNSRVGILEALATTHALSGNATTAHRILKQIKRLSKVTYVSPYCLGCIYAAVGDLNNAFKFLELAIEERSHLLIGLKIDPRLDRLRTDLRFSKLLRRVDLASQTEGQ